MIKLIAEPSLILAVVDGQLCGQDVLSDRSCDHCTDGFLQTGFHRCLGTGPEIEIRARRPHHDRPTRYIAAEKKSLRAAQHLDPLEIEIVEHNACIDPKIDSVGKDANRRVDGRDGAIDAQSADREVCVAWSRSDTLELDVGDIVAQALKVLHEFRIELRFAKCGHRDRHILQVFAVPLLGRRHNDDVRQGVGSSSRRRFLRWCRLSLIDLSLLSERWPGPDQGNRCQKQISHSSTSLTI